MAAPAQIEIVWAIPLSLMNPSELEAWLSAEEQASLPVHAHNRLCSLVGRAWVRAVLAERLGQGPPETLAMCYGPFGKPYLPGQPWHFNVAHSGDFVLLALARQPVGVDLEVIVPQRFRPNLLQRIATPVEQAWVGSDTERFFRLWCAKEACLKGLGLGIAQLQQVCLELDGQAFSATVGEAVLEGQWLNLAEGYVGAVAAQVKG